jgi:hypothetical protein
MRGDGDTEELVVTTLANIRRGVADVANLWLKLPNLADRVEAYRAMLWRVQMWRDGDMEGRGSRLAGLDSLRPLSAKEKWVHN